MISHLHNPVASSICGTAPDLALIQSVNPGELLAEKIDALLPQTQCERCGYPGCKPYAEAIAHNEADINQCPPGGTAGIHRIAILLGRKFKPLSPVHGTEMPKQIAVIDESICIGCTLCIQACPVDAIVGASKLMHTVVSAQCTGCELCIEPCPVDCIAMVNAAPQAIPPALTNNFDMNADEKMAANAARERYRFHLFRLEREQTERTERLATLAAAKRATNATPTSTQALVAAALERIKARQANMDNSPQNEQQ